MEDLISKIGSYYSGIKNRVQREIAFRQLAWEIEGNSYSLALRAGALATVVLGGPALVGCAPIYQIVQKEEVSEESLDAIKKALSQKREIKGETKKESVVDLTKILESREIQDGFLVPTEQPREMLYQGIEELARKEVTWAKKLVDEQKNRSNEVGGVLIPKAQRESKRELLRVLQKKQPLTEGLHFRYDKEKKEFTPYFNQGTKPEDPKLNPDDKVLQAFKVSDLEREVTTRPRTVFEPEPSKLTDAQLRRLAELYKKATSADERQIKDLVYGYFDKNPSLVWNVSIGLFAPDNKKANAGSTKYDNPRFEELTTPWAKVKQYVSPKTIVEAATKIQERFTDTFGKPDIFNRVRSYLKAETGTVKDSVFGLLGKDRTIENGNYTIGQFFDGNVGNYEVSHVSVQVHRNKK